MILSAYRALGTALSPFGRVFLHRRQKRGKEDPARIAERLGHPSAPRPPGQVIWIHAASVGESQSVLGLIRRLRERPAPPHILMTSGTRTSAELLAERLPDGVIHQYAPIDLPTATRRFIDHWQPDAAIWVESELWPNLIADMAATGRPMALVNARMSARSHRRWRRARRAARHLLSGFRLVLAQSEEAARRFRDLGAPEVRCEGNLKYAADMLPAEAETVTGLKTAIGERPFWLAASIHPGEEVMAGAAHKALLSAHPDLLSIIAPRHPDRAAAMSETLASAGLQVCRRSAGELLHPDTAIYMADTMGELGLLYSLDGPVFVGGSLVPHGGQNLLEPARFGRCLISGPHTANFVDVVDDLRSSEALVEIADAEELAAAVARMLAHPDEQAALGTRAERAAARQNAVLDRVLARLDPLLPT